MMLMVDIEVMQVYLNEIVKVVVLGVYVVIFMDQVGWYMIGVLILFENLLFFFLLLKLLELNLVENIWQYFCQTWFVNCVFDSYDVIFDVGCQAWNNLIVFLDVIMLIGLRDWVKVG